MQNRFLTRKARQLNEKRTAFSISGAATVGYIHMQKNEVGLLSYTVHKKITKNG